MNIQRLSIILLRSEDDIVKVHDIKKEVFSDELNRISLSGREVRLGPWEKHTFNVGVIETSKLIANGRLTTLSHSVPFRIFGSIDPQDLSRHFQNPVEFSGLCVRARYRNRGIGTSLQYFRYLLAKQLGADAILITVDQKHTRKINEMGFELYAENIKYQRLGGVRRNVFACKIDNQRLSSYFLSKLGSSIKGHIQKAFYAEIKQGLNYLPLEYDCFDLDG